MPGRRPTDAGRLFEDELRRRGVSFSTDLATRRYVVLHGGQRLLVDLGNLKRELSRTADAGYVTHFVDSVLGAANADLPSAHTLYWVLEPNEYVPDPPLYTQFSPRLNRVLVHVPEGGELLSWITAADLDSLQLDLARASELAYANLNDRLAEAHLHVEVVHGVPLAYLESDFLPKASLLLAPGLAESVREHLGWPVRAIAPARDFLMLWPAENADVVPRIARTALTEFSEGSYPLSTEVLEVGDAGVRAIGEFRPG